MTTLSARLVGGPTAVLEYGGQRWLTDPTLSAPGDYAGGLVKTTGPAFVPDDPDVVLLSHDHHADNLDPGGRELLPQAGRVLTTVAGAERLGGNAVGMEPWSSVAVGDVTVTAVPALHGPPGSEPVTGPVVDNASRDVVREIAQRAGPIGVAVLFAGAVQIPQRFGGAYLTLSADHAADAAAILDARAVVPLHFEGWTHFTQGADALRAAFAGNAMADRLMLPERGETVAV